MVNSPVIQLRNMIHSGTVGMQPILMQAIIIAKKLGQKDFGDWLESEYRGYPSKSLTPPYRLLNLPYYSQLNNGQWQNMNLDRTFLKDLLEHDTFYLFKMCAVQNPLAEVERFATSGESLTAYVTEDVRQFFVRLFGDYPSFAQFPTASQMSKIVADVKMMILNWAIDLESKGIFCEELEITSIELQKEIIQVNNNTNNFFSTVTNNGSIVAGNTGDINQQNSISVDDIASLERELKSHGLDDNDVAELKQLLEQSPKPASKEEVEKGFGSWIGKMTGKAFTGALKVAGAAAPAVLTNAICCYFGIPV
ncbi:AbiTii domain-containing protein [Klebsiella quasipneumoniae]|uniref:AbiTii domain-containing protein n=1 Tax=Klebsiella quasipneumoniae TaxID=1463165 RepID=UPI0029D9D322|nr:abortive phage resistance protein [Klebsiella quasipneumoniae]MDX7659451.1 abortive phage resistance protein [Klebsiella quasipneumoniae]